MSKQKGGGSGSRVFPVLATAIAMYLARRAVTMAWTRTTGKATRNQADLPGRRPRGSPARGDETVRRHTRGRQADRSCLRQAGCGGAQGSSANK